MSILADIVYEDKRKIYKRCMEIGFDYEDIIIETIDDLRFIIVKKEDKTYLSVRGSSNFPNWISNFKISKTTTFKGGVHKGFLECTNKLYPVIRKHIDNVSELYFSGHSLGSSLVSLLANKLYEDNFNNIKCVLMIESPNVFDKRYLNNTKHYKFKRVFIKNNIDLVKIMPPKWMGYVNYNPKTTYDCDLIYINKDNLALINPNKMSISFDKFQTYINPFNWGEIASDHSMDYVLSLVIKNEKIIKELI